MIRYEGLGIDKIYIGDKTIYKVYLGNKLIWELEILSNFFSSDNKYIVTADNKVFNCKQN